jgi:hypothetical protein
MLKGDDKVHTPEKTDRKKLIAFDHGKEIRREIPDRLAQCHAPIEKKIERDWSNLRAAGSDYDDFVDHLLELIIAVEDSGEANSAILSKPESKIVATRSHGRGTNVLRLKLLIE